MRHLARISYSAARRLVALSSITVAVAACTVQPAFAYIGPGLGAGLIATLAGIVGTVGLLLAGIIYFPIKRALKRSKSKRAEQAETDGGVAKDSHTTPEE